MENFSLSQSVIQTLAYFDIFDYPLTREELWHFLWQGDTQLTYSHFVLDLEKRIHNELQGKVENKNGYYFFSGRSEIIAKRERKILYTEEKLKIAKRATKKLRYLPFVEALFVCNQLPVGVKKNSDIDVFIVVKNGHMWFTRAVITTLLSLFFLRRSSRNVEDLICLSFYVTDQALDLSNICLASPDVYQSYWNAQLIPLYDPSQFLFEIQKNNTWLNPYLPNMVKDYILSNRYKVSSPYFTFTIKRFFEWIFSRRFAFVFERYLRFLQLQKMRLLTKDLPSHQNKNVIISDRMLKFHENDRKQYFKDQWKMRWEKYCI